MIKSMELTEREWEIVRDALWTENEAKMIDAVTFKHQSDVAMRYRQRAREAGELADRILANQLAIAERRRRDDK